MCHSKEVLINMENIPLSKFLIIESLLSYMKYRHFSDIRITEIVKKAGVSRKTFYRHFISKENILEVQFDIIYHEYISNTKAVNSYEEVIELYFKTMSNHIEFLKLINVHHLSNIAIKKSEYYLSTLNQNPKYKILDKPITAYCETFVATGLWHMFCKWLNSGRKESTQEMTAIYLSVAR